MTVVRLPRAWRQLRKQRIGLETTLHDRAIRIYGAMKKRVGPRYRGDRLMDPGRELPFTREQFEQWIVDEIFKGKPDQAAPCFYCHRWLNAGNVWIDHFVAIARRGSLDFDNLRGCCQQCNVLKGKLSPAAFDATRDFIFRLATMDGCNRLDAAEIETRLRHGSAGIRYKAEKETAAKEREKKAADAAQLETPW